MSETDLLAEIHEHCATCVRAHCVVKPDDIISCALVYCNSGCGVRLHSCKQREHRHVCRKEKVPCVNRECGCPMDIVREKMSSHLPVCPASVVVCSMEWDRWPMHSQDEGWKAPLPFKNPHVKCGQLDVAFALRDQTILVESFKSTPKKTRKILCHPLSSGYPAVPIESYSSRIESPTSESSILSDDDSGTPWDLNQSPPGLMQTIAHQLCQDNKQKAERKEAKKQLYAASKQASESLTHALDYVTGKQGLKRLAEIAKQQQEAAELYVASDDRTSVEEAATSMESLTLSTSQSAGREDASVISNVDDNEDELQIYYQKKKLYEILGLDLQMQFISSSQQKPNKMFTFLCAREFRRDEYSAHYKNYHSDIQCNLDNWFEQRCPLSYAGCTFSFQRMKPLEPSGSIVHSQILHTVGFSYEEEFQIDGNLSSRTSTSNEDIQTQVGRRKLREATPEIHTSYKCDSNVTVVPRYRSVSRESSPVKMYDVIEEFPFSLTDLPFEVLQIIVCHLDGFSLQHLSMTCKLLYNVCFSFLVPRGVVSIVWRKTKSADNDGEQNNWDIAYKRWHFTQSFQPVSRWQQTEESLSAVHEHLKVCQYNQEHDKNIKLEPFQIHAETFCAKDYN